MSEIWINDIDLADYNFVMGVDPKHGASATFSDASAAILGTVGPAWLGEATQAAARRIVVGGFFEAASLAQRLAWLDTLKALSTLGAVRLRFADRPDQEFVDARLVDFGPTPKAALLTNRATDLQITFELTDVLRYDVHPIGFALSTSRTVLPLGTGPCFANLSINGNGSSLSNFGWILRNAAGDPVQSQSFVGSLGANDRFVIDKRILLTLYTAGVASDGFSFWPPGNGDFLALLPTDAAYEQGGFPTIELTGTGTPVGRITYKRANL
jgi:hypothetical protein